jgi:ribonuclease J
VTTVTVLAGARTIGGTLIVVEDEGARLLFDAGMAFDPAGDPFAHVVNNRDRAFTNVLSLGLAPYIPDFFDPAPAAGARSLPSPAIAPGSGPRAVLLSHSHLDHSHLAGFVDPSIPIHASAACARIVDLQGRTARSISPAPRSLVVPPEEHFTVGPMEVELLPVDHDVCGARGAIIRTTGGTIAYSGDLRLHGVHPDESLAFVRAAREAEAAVLILEGTRLSPSAAPAGPHGRAESEVAPAAAAIMERYAKRPATVLLTPENGERVEALARAAADAERLLLLTPEEHATVEAALGRPIAEPFGIYAEPSMAREETRDNRLVDRTEVAADPGAYLVALPFPRFADFLDIVRPEQGGVVMHANGAPLGPFDPAWPALQWWAGRLGLQVLDIGSSGHAAPSALATLARESGAPTVMAIHSRAPEAMPVEPERLLLPVLGRRYDLRALR